MTDWVNFLVKWQERPHLSNIMHYELGYEPLMNSALWSSWEIGCGREMNQRKQERRFSKKEKETSHSHSAFFCPNLIFSFKTDTQVMNVVTYQWEIIIDALLICKDFFLLNVHQFFCWYICYFTMYYDRWI